jgi:hypothetical protein
LGLFQSVLLFFLVIFIAFQAKAQQVSPLVPQNAAEIELISYRLFKEYKWDSLILISKKALKDGVDYFYLRERLGIAFYEKRNYRMAVLHLEAAHQMSPEDAYNNATLYWSYLNAGRRGDASLIGTKMTDDNKAYYRYKESKWLESVLVETGPTISGNYTAHEDINMRGFDSIYGESDLSGNSYYNHVGITTKFAPWLKIYQGYSQINTDMQKHFVFRTLYPAKTEHDSIYTYHNAQNEYYFSASIFAKKGLTITPSFHYIYSEAHPRNFRYYWDTTYYWANPEWDTAQSYLYYDNYAMIDTSRIFHNYVVSLGVSYDYKKINLSAFGTFSKINNLNQKIAGFSLSWFPKGNLDIYSVSSASWMQTEYWKLRGGQSNGKSGYVIRNANRIILGQKIGLKLQHKIWLEGNISFGDLDLYSDQNAFVVFNVVDKIKQKMGLALICPINPKYELFLRYNRYQRESTYITFTGTDSYYSKSVSYLNHSIIGGVKWYF